MPQLAQQVLVERFLSWDRVHERLARYEHIGRAYPIELLERHKTFSPYFCHYMAWRLGTWNNEGLIPAIAQEADTGKILMVAWMNRQALEKTAASGEAVYWSRSRNRLWHKGEDSGHVQKVRELRLDCDNDVLQLQVEHIIHLP